MIHLNEVRATVKQGVELVAVSKFHPAALIKEAYDQGQRIFGESRVQELQAKHEALPADIQWHFIGHLQPNKVKYIAPYISLIHAVDSYKLLAEINKQAAKHDRVIPCLLELHIAQEESKYGFTPEACTALLEDGAWRALKNVQIAGLMCMASNTPDMVQVRSEFHQARVYFDELKQRFFADDPHFCERSWGMSHDYDVAMDEGATLVRVGTAIFGEREY
ncbi:YggS family pyridoxal phosphate-dependent enzyme [Prevotellamassilia timonensis]|jgi:pyridoxal phosphate enzyme (YggS family)|uniref:YggS family pyridoxal phosphate-dependent enzyme n=1 Tax=Prevotellamassilia timonensis TaxID=1852370 RepID=UPI0023F5372E|nr:YggS family pyridoxal phosphate-dependent enzyme [Prevotellamassilia timonensis]MDD7440721.1 YggS family pyridoxal phosphate-dependent enzyme [Prevotellamassilia timonensis]